MSKKEDNRETALDRPASVPRGRLLALDPGRKRIGLAVSDERQIAVRPLEPLSRTSWKRLLRAVHEIVRSFDARALVIGLPLHLDGSESDASKEARRMARNFELSLALPVFLQDERLSSREAESNLCEERLSHEGLRERVDSEAAAIILRDFIGGLEIKDH